jgi:hydrogenase nickel incorporation protein HypA/HybF
MHELSVALSLIEVASDEVARLGAVRVTVVHVRLGPLAGVVKEALLFAFDVAASGTPLEGAQLEIVDVPIAVWCSGCSAERVLESAALRQCPACRATTPKILSGEELELTGLEMTAI